MVVGALVVGGLWARGEAADDEELVEDGRAAFVEVLAGVPVQPVLEVGDVDRELGEVGLDLAGSGWSGEGLRISARVRGAPERCLVGTVAEGREPEVEVLDRAC